MMLSNKEITEIIHEKSILHIDIYKSDINKL